jgi:hypothetical protein
MSELIPPTPPFDAPSTDNPAVAAYFLQVVDHYRTQVSLLLGSVPPLELPFILAYIIGALETQQPLAGEAFEEARDFWHRLYPAVLEQHAKDHGVTATADSVLMVIPVPLMEDPNDTLSS